MVKQVIQLLPFPLLQLMAAIFRFFVLLRLTLYRMGYLRKETLSTFTISVGNLTAGGTGKTPMIEFLARFLLSKGIRPAVISRGYKRERARRIVLVSDGERILTNASSAGDEPMMLAQHVPELIVAVGNNRLSTARWLEASFHPDVFLLDDGFQHIQLDRNLDVVLVDALHPFDNGYLLPAGKLREPVSSLARASVVVITRSDRHFNPTSLEQQINSLAPGIPIFYSYHETTEIMNITSGERTSPQKLYGLRIAAFCGIGNPQSFLHDLSHYGAHIAWFREFSDHHRYKQHEVRRLYQAANETGVRYLVTTEKDWLNLEQLDLPPWPPMLVVRIQTKIDNETAFQKFVLNHLQRHTSGGQPQPPLPD
ncbi:MAG: tetraacyldisaccharide 4'-kinase [candidate division WOR-3 bacterium]